MKKLIFLILLVIPGVCFAGNYERWALVKGEEIVKFKTVKSNDTVIKPKLIAHGYLIVNKDATPAHDSITQRVDAGYRIEEKQVVNFYTLAERPFVDAKDAIIFKQKSIILNQISDSLDDKITGEKLEATLSKLRVVLKDIETKQDNDGLREVSNVSLSISP